MLRNSLYAGCVLAVFGIPPLTATTCLAAIGDYRFELIGSQPAGAGRTDVLLRLIRIGDGKPMPGAVIFLSRAVMAGMETMPGAATAEPGQQPGTYSLHVATSMAGEWTLHLSAKVQGEAATLQASVPFAASE